MFIQNAARILTHTEVYALSPPMHAPMTECAPMRRTCLSSSRKSARPSAFASMLPAVGRVCVEGRKGVRHMADRAMEGAVQEEGAV